MTVLDSVKSCESHILNFLSAGQTQSKREIEMARKTNYGFEKRQKELAKKAKKDEKKMRKQEEKNQDGQETSDEDQSAPRVD